MRANINHTLRYHQDIGLSHNFLANAVNEKLFDALHQGSSEDFLIHIHRKCFPRSTATTLKVCCVSSLLSILVSGFPYSHMTIMCLFISAIDVDFSVYEYDVGTTRHKQAVRCSSSCTDGLLLPDSVSVRNQGESRNGHFCMRKLSPWILTSSLTSCREYE